jgi:hypothetical protein
MAGTNRTTCLRPSERPMWRGCLAIYVPLTHGGKIVLPLPYPETVSSNRAETRQLYRSFK